MAPARNQDDTSPPHWPPALPGLILENLREYAVFATDLAGVVVGCNPGVENVLGYVPADFIGRDARCLFTEEERAANVPEQEMATARKQGRAADERWHIKANGEHFFAYGVMSALESETGELLGYAKIVRDATDTHVQRQNLEASEALFRTTILQAPIPMIVHTAQGEVRHLSRAFSDLTGYQKEDLPDSASWLRKGLRVSEEALFEWRRQLEQRNTAPPEELTVYTATGEARSWRLYTSEALRVAGEQFFVVAALDLTERKRAEETLATLNRELEKRVEARTQQVQHLSRQLTLAEAQARSRLAQVLHDGLQQQLYAVQFALRDIRLAAGDNPHVLAQLDRTSTLVKEAVQLARTTTTDLSPPVLAGEGLVEALRWLDTDMQRRYGLSVSVKATEALTVPDEAVRVLLFNLVRELLFNVVKHAGVEEAKVALAEAEEQLSITVSDGGRGFNPARLDGAATGLGLSGIRKRLGLFSGRLEVDTRPGKGTQVTITLPTSALKVG